MHSAFGQPILIRDNLTSRLRRVDDFDEAYVRDLVFHHADCLPISEIDDAFVPLVPICMESRISV